MTRPGQGSGTMTAVADKLREAKALIEPRGAWTQGDYSRTCKGQMSFCVRGALNAVGAPYEATRLLSAAAVKHSLYGTPGIRLIDWNDEPQRKKKDPTVTDAKLEPCPFCGDTFVDAEVSWLNGCLAPTGDAVCQGCGATAPIGIWNTRTATNRASEGEMRERVRDFIYDCTKDEFNTGWTLSAHQTDDLIEMVAALTAKPDPEAERTELVEAAEYAHRTLVDLHIARTLNDCRVGGAATAISAVVNKLRTALAREQAGGAP